MTRLEKLIAFMVFALLPLAACQQKTSPNPDDKIEKIHEILTQYTDYGGFNGSVLIAHEGELLYQNGFGMANMEWDVLNESDTKFQIASLTKQFTAMLIMQLVAADSLDLQAPISTYLPEYPEQVADLVTIHQLLTHSSGISNAGGEEKFSQPRDLVAQFENDPLLFAPGERFDYSNSGYTLLGYLLETRTGKSYEALLKERIFDPLEMKSSGYFRYQPIIKKMASGYFKGFGDYFDVRQTDESSAYSAGGIYSTVEDLLLWDQALYTETLLPKKYLDLIFTKHIADPDYGGYYGYGWELITQDIGNTGENLETIGHGGSISGFRAVIKRIPSSQSTIILLNNTDHAFLNAITKSILGILEETTYDLPLKPLALFMTQEIEKNGIESGISYFQKHQDLPEYYVSEQELIVAGYRLLQAGNAKDAAEVFKLSIEVFPERDNPYDSYAEALMALGKKEEAIANYKKSLELNPNNRNAANWIEKLEK